MSMEDLERYESELELSLYREYRDVVGMFTWVVETERRFYLANHVEVTPKVVEGDTWFEVELSDAWVWDMYRPVRFLSTVLPPRRRQRPAVVGAVRIDHAMGFNATRKYRDAKWRDISLLIAAIVIVGGLLAWAVGVF